MQIAPVPYIAPVVTDRVVAQLSHQAVAQQKPVAAKPKAPFTPAPPLRPTTQDKADMNRSLKLLRTV